MHPIRIKHTAGEYQIEDGVANTSVGFRQAQHGGSRGRKRQKPSEIHL